MDGISFFVVIKEYHKSIQKDYSFIENFLLSSSYRDVVFIICILKEYIKLTDEEEGHIWQYYREQFSKLADRLSEQIDYDYDSQMEKCIKKIGKKERNDDVGEDAMALAVKRGKK